MSTNTTNMAMGKAVDGDNAKTYLETTLGAALDKIDAHDHSGGTHGLNTFTGGLTISASGLQVTAGNVGIGIAPQVHEGLVVSGTLGSSSNQSYGINASLTGPSGSTTEIGGFLAQPGTAATAFTCTTISGFHALNPVKGAGSTITSAYGLLVDAINVGSTNNYGIYTNIPSGGSGDNGSVLSGDVMVGGGYGSANATNATTGFLFLNTCPGTPTGVPSRAGAGLGVGHEAMIYDTTNNKLYIYNGGWKGVTLA